MTLQCGTVSEQSREPTARRFPLSDEHEVAPLLLRPAVGCLLLPMLALVSAAIIGGADGSSWAMMPLGVVLLLYVVVGLRGWIRRRTNGVVTVGSDGVLVERGRDTLFIPYDEIVTIKRPLRGTHNCTLMRGGGRETSFGPANARLLKELETRWNAYNRALDTAVELRRTEEILAEASRRGGYRAAGHDEGALTALVEDPSAPLGLRAEAAATLEQRGRGGLTKLRIHAHELAEPGGREALLRIASAPETERQALIDALADEEAETAAAATE